jgi:hypothetical protein
MQVAGGMSDFPDEDAWQTHFGHYVQAIACKTIGDAGQYTKHLQRKTADGDAAAVAQTAALEFFAGLESQVQRALEDLRLLGQERVSRVCDAIREQSSLPFAQVRQWGICALSGTPSNCNVQIRGGDSTVWLALEFEAFATALWLVHHMAVIEKSRAAAFANGSPENATISAIVTAYCEDQEKANAGAIYAWAFRVVRETMAATRARLDEYLREVARVQAVV